MLLEVDYIRSHYLFKMFFYNHFNTFIVKHLMLAMYTDFFKEQTLKDKLKSDECIMVINRKDVLLI